MANHRNMFGTFYGNSSRSGNSTSSRGMGARRSSNGGVSMGNGNLIQRAQGGPNALIQCTCPNGYNCGPVSNRGQCRRCCRRNGSPFGAVAGGVNSGRRNGGFGGGSLRDLDISVKMKRTQKQCFCSAPEGSGLGNQTIICNRLRNCTNCCQSRFGEMWGGEDVIQGVGRRR